MLCSRNFRVRCSPDRTRFGLQEERLRTRSARQREVALSQMTDSAGGKGARNPDPLPCGDTGCPRNVHACLKRAFGPGYRPQTSLRCPSISNRLALRLTKWWRNLSVACLSLFQCLNAQRCSSAWRVAACRNSNSRSISLDIMNLSTRPPSLPNGSAYSTVSLSRVPSCLSRNWCLCFQLLKGDFSAVSVNSLGGFTMVNLAFHATHIGPTFTRNSCTTPSLTLKSLLTHCIFLLGGVSTVRASAEEWKFQTESISAFKKHSNVLVAMRVGLTTSHSCIHEEIFAESTMC